MYKTIFIISLLLYSFTENVTTAQKLQKSRIKLESYKNPDQTISLVATIKARKKRYYSLKNVFINFYNINDTSKVLMKKIKTNKKGVALLQLSEEFNISKDTSGIMSFEAVFAGNDTIKKAHKTIGFKDAKLVVLFNLKDSVKVIELKANELSADRPAIANTDVALYIKGSFSLLKIGSVETDDDGNATLEFPLGIHGDTAGVVTIVAQIEDNDDYGNVIAEKNINWAIPLVSKSLDKRGLTRPNAPIWMVITLIILLSLVWFHYGYIVYALIKIKKEETKTQANESIA